MNSSSIKNEVNKELVLNKLFQIYSILKKENLYIKANPGLTGGKAGVAAFLFYYSKLIDNQEPYDLAIDLLSKVLEDINNGFKYHTHAIGISGIGILIEILAKEGIIEADTNQLLKGADNYLYVNMVHELENGNYDFLHGAVGIALYFLKRLSNKDLYPYLSKFIHKLDSIAHKDEQGIRWFSVLNKEKNIQGYDLSMSHGISSIIVLLSKLFNAGIEKKKVSNLLQGAIKYLLNQQNDISIHDSYFPNWVCESESPTRSRLSWCYGDLGISVALWNASQAIKNKVWANKAIEVLLYSTKRTVLIKEGISDAGLCHGTAGIAHIFKRMYKNTHIMALGSSAEYWYSETLKMVKFNNDLSGFKVWDYRKHRNCNLEYGFLDGLSGTGLSLISAISDIEPNWDECLLLS